jgi:hypothetical protein
MPNRSGYNVLSGSEQSVDAIPIGGAMRTDEGDQAILQGRTALSRGLADLSGTIQNAFLLSQRAKNEADLVRGRLEMKKIAGENQIELEKRSGNPDEWEGITKDVVTAGRPRVFGETAEKKSKISGPVKKQLEEEWAAFEQDQTQGVEFQALRQTNKQSDEAFEQAAAIAYNEGRYEDGDAEMDKRADLGTQSAKLVKDVLKPKGREAGARTQVKVRLEAIEAMTPREQEIAYRDLPKELEAVQHLSKPDRLVVESKAIQLQRQAGRALDTNALQTVRGLRNGSLTLADVAKSDEAGELRDLAMAPEFEAASGAFQAEEREKVQTAREQKQSKARAAEGRFEALSKDALYEGKVGLEGIDKAIQRGEATPGQAAELKNRLEVVSLAQQTEAPGDDRNPNFSSISDKLDNLFAAGSLDLRPGHQPDPEEYTKIYEQIQQAKITMPNKLALMERFYAAKLADVSDLEEEGTGRWLDRDISKPEAVLRTDLIRSYKEILPSLGLQQAGALLFSQEDQIIRFFEGREKPPAPAELKAFHDALFATARGSASSDLIAASFGF